MSRLMKVVERVLAMLLCIGVAVGAGVVLVQCPFAEPKLPTLASVAIGVAGFVAIAMLAIIIAESIKEMKE